MEVIEGDCLEVMRGMADNSFDAIVTDPPYFKVKKESWDRQWGNASLFLDWLDDCAKEWQRLLKPNGSLYVFASPKMSARVECKIGERFNVLNRITWQKPPFSTKAEMFKKETMRAFFPASESIIFAEHYGADNIAKGEAGYEAKCDELRGFIFEPLRAYLDGERQRAELSTTQLHEAWMEKTGTRGRMVGHWFGRSQWDLPTRENYEWLRQTMARLNHGGEYLRREYEYLRREYEDLRREYEDLRRPFSVTKDDHFTDVWTFKTVTAYSGKHPCEKPIELMEHIIKASTRPGAVVLDPFCGSGSTGVACRNLGRDFVGIEKDPLWVRKATDRINSVQLTLGVKE